MSEPPYIDPVAAKLEKARLQLAAVTEDREKLLERCTHQMLDTPKGYVPVSELEPTIRLLNEWIDGRLTTFEAVDFVAELTRLEALKGKYE